MEYVLRSMPESVDERSDYHDPHLIQGRDAFDRGLYAGMNFNLSIKLLFIKVII